MTKPRQLSRRLNEPCCRSSPAAWSCSALRLADAPLPELLGALLQVADKGRLHYGSDWPFTPADACEKLARQLDATPLLDPETRRAAMSENARRLFPRLAR